MLREGFSTLFLRPRPITTPTEEVYQESGIQFLKKSKIIYAGIFLIIVLGLIFLFTPYFMNVLGTLAFSIMPAAILFAWVMKTDKYEPEPKSLALATIGLGGCVSAFFSMIMFPRGLEYYFLKIILIETVFFLLLVGLDSNRITGREFNDHLDGAVYGLSLGLGYVLYDNFTKIFFTPSIVNPFMLTLLAAEDVFISIFPALTGWWIGYVKAKYASVKITDLIAGFIPICIIRILYEFSVLAASSLSLTLRLVVVLSIGLLILSILVRRIRWALEDQRLWGYHIGKAPIEGGDSR